MWKNIKIEIFQPEPKTPKEIAKNLLKEMTNNVDGLINNIMLFLHTDMKYGLMNDERREYWLKVIVEIEKSRNCEIVVKEFNNELERILEI